jgi:hypothetical protein
MILLYVAIMKRNRRLERLLASTEPEYGLGELLATKGRSIRAVAGQVRSTLNQRRQYLSTLEANGADPTLIGSVRQEIVEHEVELRRVEDTTGASEFRALAKSAQDKRNYLAQLRQNHAPEAACEAVVIELRVLKDRMATLRAKVEAEVSSPAPAKAVG